MTKKTQEVAKRVQHTEDVLDAMCKHCGRKCLCAILQILLCLLTDSTLSRAPFPNAYQPPQYLRSWSARSVALSTKILFKTGKLALHKKIQSYDSNCVYDPAKQAPTPANKHANREQILSFSMCVIPLQSASSLHLCGMQIGRLQWLINRVCKFDSTESKAARNFTKKKTSQQHTENLSVHGVRVSELQHCPLK